MNGNFGDARRSCAHVFLVLCLFENRYSSGALPYWSLRRHEEAEFCSLSMSADIEDSDSLSRINFQFFEISSGDCFSQSSSMLILWRISFT